MTHCGQSLDLRFRQTAWSLWNDVRSRAENRRFSGTKGLVSMGKIGFTYGSEWHLLRYLGYRNELNRQIEEVIPAKNVKIESWSDFHFYEGPIANLHPP